MRRRSWRLVAVAVLLGASGSVIAGRPFTAEDAETIAPDRCELEAFQAYARAGGVESARSTAAQLSCGVGANTQLALAIARNREDGRHWPALAVVGKTALRPVAERDLGVALAYSLTGERRPGRSNEFTRASLALVATELRGSVQFHGNVGLTRDRIAHDTSTIWAFAMEQLGERLDYGLELFGEDSRSAFVGAGVRFAAVPGRLYFDGSYAIQSNSARERRYSFGMKAAF